VRCIFVLFADQQDKGQHAQHQRQIFNIATAKST
jgi:hypothetical protein